RIAGVERIARQGEHVIVAPATPHIAWNPTDGVVRVRITMTPALRWAEFTERLFSGENGAQLLSEFSREVAVVGRSSGSQTRLGPS
ncbi:MAG TPA: hypothetical protein VGX03_25025, partial [Candidatus Binatia bacterium]|nr:hypothetical protein [Candidatus Binatia bacterium]